MKHLSQIAFIKTSDIVNKLFYSKKEKPACIKSCALPLILSLELFLVFALLCSKTHWHHLIFLLGYIFLTVLI